ncbi:GL22148 [Drosophila persimilis]|uniref:GL22148 n=1 Tax=Drosophila persimilis TaxID=7234 RepID=B4H6W0_DROPE|nr:GL22148 [Drosophila persimilis]
MTRIQQQLRTPVQGTAHGSATDDGRWTADCYHTPDSGQTLRVANDNNAARMAAAASASAAAETAPAA